MRLTNFLKKAKYNAKLVTCAVHHMVGLKTVLADRRLRQFKMRFPNTVQCVQSFAPTSLFGPLAAISLQNRPNALESGSRQNIGPTFILDLLPLGEAIESRAVFVIVFGSDGGAETLLELTK